MSLRRFSLVMAAIVVAASGLMTLAPAAQQIGPASDTMLFGTITSASGQPLDGIVVSARREGKRITTSVFTDERGRYYFPPLASGQYRVWAQAVGFQTAHATVDVAT